MNDFCYHRSKFCRHRPYLSGPSPDILKNISRFRTHFVFYSTEFAFGLYFHEKNIQFGHVTEAETRERWHNMASDRKNSYMKLRTSIKRYRVKWRNFWMEECGKSDKFVKTMFDIMKKADEESIKIKQDHARDLAREYVAWASQATHQPFSLR